MKKLPSITLLWAAIFLCLGGAARAQEDPPVRVARLSYVSGDVSFQPGGEDDWAWAGINRPMTRGDALWVESGSRAELAIGANVMRLGEETDFSFLDLDDDIVQIQLNAGAISFTVRRLYRGETIEIDTPNVAVLLDAPGTYRIDADPYGDFTSVTVREGRASVLGSADSYVVDPGTELQAEGIDRLRFAVYDMPADDDLDRFADSRDRRFDRSESARYVSFDVTGFVDLDGRGTWRTDPSYGPVWVPRVATGWAPFRDGTWAWIDPWGWTWIDEAEWGFATSHFGRWVRLGRPGQYAWAWVPPRPSRRGPHGPQSYPVEVADRCVYSPANVTFLGMPSDSRVAWFPLAPGEVYVPAFHASITFINQLNITNTTVQINFVQTVINTPPERVRYVNRVAEAVVVVPRTVFVAAQPVARARVQVSTEFVRSPVIRSAPVAPARVSVFGDVKVKTVASVAPKPPVEVRSRKVVVKTTPPPKRVPFVQKERVLAADPGKPVDRKAERTIAAAAPARPAASVVKAEASTAPPKETAQSPKAGTRQARREMRKVDRNPAPAPAPSSQPQPQTQATPPPPAPSAQDNARQQAERTQQEQAAARKAEADKRRADQAAAQQQAAKTKQEQEAAQQQAEKTRQEQQAARQAEADKRRADQVAAQQQAAKTKQEQEAAQQQAEKTRQEQQAARQAEADKRRADQVAAQQQAAKTKQEQEAARQAEADKRQADQQAARKAEADKKRADEEAARQAQADSGNAAASGRSRGTHTPTEAGAPPRAVRMTESAQAAKLVSQPDVVPPANAKDVHGAVVVRARIGTDGKVKSAQAVRGPKQLEQAALQNARGRVYQPTLVDGKPVEVDTEITVKF